jgi:glycosyltransferase involved in cell wall biosynthesis
MAHTRTGVKLEIAGKSSSAAYAAELRKLIQELGVSEKITLRDEWISEQDKAHLINHSLCVLQVPFDEDSYGYLALEAGEAEKPILTTVDSGGVLEFVQDGVQGLILEPNPIEIGRALDLLFEEKALARKLGIAAKERLAELSINWDRVIGELTK